MFQLKLQFETNLKQNLKRVWNQNPKQWRAIHPHRTGTDEFSCLRKRIGKLPQTNYIGTWSHTCGSKYGCQWLNIGVNGRFCFLLIPKCPSTCLFFACVCSLLHLADGQSQEIFQQQFALTRDFRITSASGTETSMYTECSHWNPNLKPIWKSLTPFWKCLKPGSFPWMDCSPRMLLFRQWRFASEYAANSSQL